MPKYLASSTCVTDCANSSFFKFAYNFCPPFRVFLLRFIAITCNMCYCIISLVGKFSKKEVDVC